MINVYFLSSSPSILLFNGLSDITVYQLRSILFFLIFFFRVCVASCLGSIEKHIKELYPMCLYWFTSVTENTSLSWSWIMIYSIWHIKIDWKAKYERKQYGIIIIKWKKKNTWSWFYERGCMLWVIIMLEKIWDKQIERYIAEDVSLCMV